MLRTKRIETVIAKLIGTSDLPVEQQFSIEAIEKAAREFQKLAIDRGGRVPDEDVEKYIKATGGLAS